MKEKAELGKTLRKLRQDAIDGGMPLVPADEVAESCKAWRDEARTNEHGMQHLAERAIRVLEKST